MSRDRVYALLILAFVVFLLIWSSVIHHNHPDDWLFANAGPGMIKTCALIVAVWWSGFGLWAFVGWWRETYGASSAEQARQGAAPVERTARVVVPVPPETEPAVNE